MLETIPVPAQSKFGAAVARRLNASIPIAPSGTLAMSGPTGTGFAPLPSNLRDRRVVSADLHPWKVFAVGKSETVDHFFEIYVPAGSLHVGEDVIEVGDLTPVEDKPDRYTLDCEDEISESAVIYLAIVKEEEEESAGVSPDGEDEQPDWKARIVSTLESIEDAKEVLAVLPIAKLSVDESGDLPRGKVDAQYAHSAVALSEGGAVAVDKVSIDKLGGEDKNALELAHFADGEKDSGKGLETRLKADPETGEISGVDDDGLMLVARKDGQLIYVPIKGKGKDPDPPEDPNKGCNDHPGGSEGVSKFDDDPGRYVPSTGGVPKGGVSKGGGSVTNCCS